MIYCIYRLSDNGYPKEKFAFATKSYCLKNFVRNVAGRYTLNNTNQCTVHILVDNTNLQDSTFAEVYDLAKLLGLEFRRYDGGSSAGSWRYATDYALNIDGIKDDDYIYFVEDDYLHTPDAYDILLEGLQAADYVSLYDHPDKYIPASKGGNPFISDDGGEITKVILTKSTHWKLTNSTTMTLAVKVSTFKEDKPVWDKWTVGTYPHDFDAFIELRQKGRSLITPIPSRSTHCLPEWAAPLVDWSRV